MEVLLSHIQLDVDLKSVLTPKSILRRQNGQFFMTIIFFSADPTMCINSNFLLVLFMET